MADFFNAPEDAITTSQSSTKWHRRRYGLRQQELPGALGRCHDARAWPARSSPTPPSTSSCRSWPSKQPVGPVVRQGDADWFSVVRWTIYALIAAEELGVNSGNVEAMKGSGSSEVRRFLGIDFDFGKRLRLEPRLDAARHQAGRQLRRAVRPPPRPEVASEARTATEQPAANGGLHYAPSFR